MPKINPMTSASSGTSSGAVPFRQDARTIGLVGLAHGSSHFFHMLLPPLFPWLIGEFGFSYSELGLLVSVFFVISGVGQALSGFIVDRVGARPVMFFALSSFATAGLVAGTAQGYAGLLVAAALAGLGNAPFHPVDFTILNKRVSPQRLGHGFSVHGISGNLGWATAPVFMAGIATATGSCRTACLCGGLLALVVLAIMVWNRDAIDDRQGSWAHQAKGGAGAAAKPEHPMAFLKLPSVWLCFSFFFWSTCALSAIQSFASPALQSMYGRPRSVTELRKHVLLGFSQRESLNHWPLSGEHGDRLHIKPTMKASSGETLRLLALQGEGIVCLSDFMTQEDRRRGDLVQVLPRHTVQVLQPIHAVYYRSAQVSPRIACFLDFMDEQLKQAAWNVR